MAQRKSRPVGGRGTADMIAHHQAQRARTPQTGQLPIQAQPIADTLKLFRDREMAGRLPVQSQPIGQPQPISQQPLPVQAQPIGQPTEMYQRFRDSYGDRLPVQSQPINKQLPIQAQPIDDMLKRFREFNGGGLLPAQPQPVQNGQIAQPQPIGQQPLPAQPQPVGSQPKPVLPAQPQPIGQPKPVTGTPKPMPTQEDIKKHNDYQKAYNALPSTMKGEEKYWWLNYTKMIQNGTADPTKMQYYNNLAKKYGLQKTSINKTQLQQLSIKALSGDKKAQEYLKAMHLSPLTGNSLWSGYDLSTLGTGDATTRWQYMKDNPYSDFTKNYDTQHYQRYNEMIMNNKPMTEQQKKWYEATVKKWGLDDMNDPMNQQKYQLDQAEKKALEAQDVSLNNSMATLDANNFQKYTSLQQDMSERGMGDSGIASDSYTRMQMGANRDYQDAYTQAANTKSEIKGIYTDKRNELSQKQADLELKQNELMSNSQLELNKQKMEQDKYMTQSTGVLYANGKPVMYKGKPITTLEYQKLSETQRHNLVTENNIKNGQQLDYSLGLIKNQTDLAKINADVQKSLANLKLNYAKLDFDYAKLEANNKIAQDKIKIAADNAQTAKDKNQITALGKQLNDLNKQIVAAQKAGKKPDKAIVDKYNQVNDALNAFMGK